MKDLLKMIFFQEKESLQLLRASILVYSKMEHNMVTDNFLGKMDQCSEEIIFKVKEMVTDNIMMETPKV